MATRKRTPKARAEPAPLKHPPSGGLALRCHLVDRHMLLQADPRAFYVTPHYQDWPMVLIDLSAVRWDAMPGLIEAAWPIVAPSRLVKNFDAARGN